MADSRSKSIDPCMGDAQFSPVQTYGQRGEALQMELGEVPSVDAGCSDGTAFAFIGH